MMGLVESMRSKVHRPKPATVSNRATVKITAGWQHYSYGAHRYILMKASVSRPNVGPRQIPLIRDSDYDGVLTALRDVFYPNGRSLKGKVIQMTTMVGNAQGQEIDKDNFTTLQKFIESSSTLKPRLYLLTKQKQWTAKADSSESDCDFLPDIQPQEGRLPLSMDVSSVQSPTSTANQRTPAPNAAVPTSTAPNVSSVADQLQPLDPYVHVNAGTPTVSVKAPRHTCPVCLIRERDAYFSPCGHTVCGPCGFHMEHLKQHCHTCRGFVQEVRPLYQ